MNATLWNPCFDARINPNTCSLRLIPSIKCIMSQTVYYFHLRLPVDPQALPWKKGWRRRGVSVPNREFWGRPCRLAIRGVRVNHYHLSSRLILIFCRNFRDGRVYMKPEGEDPAIHTAPADNHRSKFVSTHWMWWIKRTKSPPTMFTRWS
jgi:hypothetical protein